MSELESDGEKLLLRMQIGINFHEPYENLAKEILELEKLVEHV